MLRRSLSLSPPPLLCAQAWWTQNAGARDTVVSVKRPGGGRPPRWNRESVTGRLGCLLGNKTCGFRLTSFFAPRDLRGGVVGGMRDGLGVPGFGDEMLEGQRRL